MNMAGPLPPGASAKISDAAQATAVTVDNELDTQVLRKQMRRSQVRHLVAGKTNRKRLTASPQTGHRVDGFLSDPTLSEAFGAV